MPDEIEEQINISVEDCKRWSEDINERLHEIRAQDGEDTYKLMFVTAFLLQWFAMSIDGTGDESLVITKPTRKDLN